MAHGSGMRFAVEIDDGVMDGLVEGGYVCEGLVGREVMDALRSRQTGSISLSSGAYFGSHSRVSQACARAARAASRRLLEWIGPLSSTSNVTGLTVCRPGCGPKRRGRVAPDVR